MNIYHVTGRYAFGNDIHGRYIEKHSIVLDTVVQATDEERAIDYAIAAAVQVVPDWEDLDEIEAAPASAEQRECFEIREAQAYQALYSEPLFAMPYDTARRNDNHSVLGG